MTTDRNMIRDDELHATVSIQQPWAWAIVHGPKRIENRTWYTDYRGPLLIHTGKSRERLGDFGDDYAETGFTEPAESEMAFGAIIGVCDLVECLKYEVVKLDVKRDPFAEGPWCWMLENVRPMKPVQYPGQQGIFRVCEQRLAYVEGWAEYFAGIRKVAADHLAGAV